MIVIGGPTASGKTRLALYLAEQFKAHIFSADSRQVYKELTIGTAKPDPAVLEKIPHHFVNHISVQDYYSTGRYEKELKEKLNDYFIDHDVAIVAGGTGLYLKSIAESLDDIPSVTPDILAELKRMLEEKGIESLQNMLLERDPAYYSKVDKNNPHRLIRALSVCLVSGTPYSSFLGKKKKQELSYTPINIFLNPPREYLYKAINERVDEMILAGLEEEVRSLEPFRDEMALKTVGYEEFFQFFSGIITRERAIELIKQNSRRYAKRQVTWFKKFGNGKWFSGEEENEICEYVRARMAE